MDKLNSWINTEISGWAQMYCAPEDAVRDALAGALIESIDFDAFAAEMQERLVNKGYTYKI